jgi:hypothetical protein
LIIQIEKAMYNEELEKLIAEFISDGEVSENERRILLKKAKNLGIDKEEFEEVLNSRLKLANIHSKGKSNKKKCPHCGNSIASISNVCDYCGFVLNLGLEEDSFKKLSIEMEKSLRAMQAIKLESIFVLIKENLSTFLFIIFTVASWILVLVTSNSWFFISILFWLIAIVLTFSAGNFIYKKGKREDWWVTDSKERNFRQLKTNFNNHLNRGKIIYGNDLKISHLLDNYEKEFGSILSARKKKKSINIFVFSIFIIFIGLISIFLYYSFSPEPNSKKVNKLLNAENSINAYNYFLQKEKNVNSETQIRLFDALIKDNLLKEAENAIPEYYSRDYVSTLLTKYSLKGSLEDAERLYYSWYSNEDYYLPNELHNAMMDAYILSGNYQKAKDFMMSFRNWTEASSLYNRMIISYLKKKDKTSARKILFMLTDEVDKKELKLLIDNY